MPPTKEKEIQNEISTSIDLLCKHLPRLLTYLRKEIELDNYVEIELPILNMSISYKLAIFVDRLIITVINYDGSEIYGHLLIDEFNSIGEKEIKKLGIKGRTINQFNT